MGRTRTTSQRIKAALKVINDFDTGKFPESEEPKRTRLPVWIIENPDEQEKEFKYMIFGQPEVAKAYVEANKVAPYNRRWTEPRKVSAEEAEKILGHKLD